MAAPLLFYDLSLLPSSSSSGDGRDGTSNSSSSSSRLQLLAATLELGYAAVALDHPHRGLLADSHRCRTERFAPLSSLPLPSSAALHPLPLSIASPASEPFHQYTRITLSLDSAAAAASALAPSTARLLRTYDLVAARPLTQAAFDHLCQASITAQHLDLISIDFSSHTKLPFRIKPSMLKVALQKGLHFEIAYSPLVSTDVNAKRNLIAEVKLLVEWTKGKNLIISSAAHTASQIRGPYDIINLSAYLLGIPIDRAKAAMSTNCRLLVSKAMRKKHFYKETIRVDRLLPNEELSSTKFKFADWIGWNSVSSEGCANKMVPSSDFDELTSSPTCIVMEGSHEKPHRPDVSVFAKLSEQSCGQEQIPSKNQEETLQVDRTEVLTDCGQSVLPASLNYLEKAENNEVDLNPFVQAGAGCSADPKVIVNVKHVEFLQDAMEVDMTESCWPSLVLGENIPSTSDTSTKLACCAFPRGIELSATILGNQGPSHSSEILADDKSCMKYHTECTSVVIEKTVLAHEISSGVDVCPEDKDSDTSNRMQIDNEAYKPLECPPGGVDDKEPSDLSFYSSHELCRDVIIHPKVTERKVEQSSDENIAQTVQNEAESIDTKTRTSLSVEPMSHGQEISSASYTRSTGAGCKSDELKEQNSKDINASLNKSVDKTQELLQLPYPSAKRSHKLRLHHPAYLPFLGFLRSVCFKKKICKVRGLIKHA